MIAVAGHRKWIAGAVQLLHLYDTEPQTASWAVWDQRIFTNAETVQLLQTRYLELPHSVPAMAALRSALHITPTATLTAAHLITRASGMRPALAAGFFHDLILAARPETAGPLPDLHTSVRAGGIAPRGRRGVGQVSARRLSCIITSWNAYTAGDTWEAAFGPDDPMPATHSVTTAPPPVAADDFCV
ncbi:hypothetical protein [Streptomyces violascens]|uniref:Uncharacterized protein n=1 Tax=Streptomyces violascens TaxID=67381 RepID=A0ABQ3QS32_9ACTN|nr:hypothetical protein [Streptomyces violascens]GHI40067.1 hypothetical protein Sviol_44750 [Streptomyces violascens]